MLWLRSFGPFCLDPETGELTRNSHRLRLQPQPTRLLILLTESPGRLLPRQEIQQQIWGSDTFVDFDQSLNFAVRQIRLTLRDSAENPKYVETVPKRGYRFVAPVQLVPKPDNRAASLSSPAADPIPETVLPETTQANSMPFLWSGAFQKQWVLITCAVLLLLAASIPLSIRLHSLNASSPKDLSIAVLPFEDLTGDPARKYLSHGMTDEIISRLARSSEDRLRVAADSSVTAGRQGSGDLQKIARELGVEYIVRGTIQSESNHLRVHVHLVRARDLREMWSDAYDGDQKQLLAMENTVSESVLRALSLRIATNSTAVSHEPSFESHDSYLKGLDQLSERSRSGFEEALHSFSSAIEADPHYANAYAELATTYNLMGQYGWTSPREARTLGSAAARQALAIEPLNARAHAALGFSLWFYDWDVAGGEKELLRSISLDPHSVDGHHWYANLLMTQGRFAEAEQQMRLALWLDPKSPILRTNLGWIHYMSRDYPLALSEITQVVNEKPDFLTAHYKLWYIYSAQHDHAHAWREFEWIAGAGYEQLKDATEVAYHARGYAAALKAFAKDPELSSESMVDRARFLVCAGDNRAALEMLEHAHQAHEGWLVFVSQDPIFDPLHSNPVFSELTANLESATNRQLLTSLTMHAPNSSHRKVY